MHIPCLSIQQPWAAMILIGEKVVENRSWRWKTASDGQKGEKVLLGIHASTSREEWSKRTAEEKEKYIPDWRNATSLQFGSVLGVVDLVCICRPNDLPATLLQHKYVKRGAGNWCWVLENPRRLEKPLPATGQSSLFYVVVPDSYLPTSLRVAEGSMAIDSRCLVVTKGNLNNNSLCLSSGLDLFPEDVFGESSQGARRTVRVIWGEEVVETDIVRTKNIFRRRTWGKFYNANRIQAGDRILLERLEPYLYRISKG